MNAWIFIPFILSPFIYLAFAFVVSFLVTRYVRKKLGSERLLKSLFFGVGAFVMVILIPTWNIFAARIYMYYRCEMDGGLHLYEQVELADRYYDSFGNPNPVISSDVDGSSFVLCFDDRCFIWKKIRSEILSLPPGSKVSRIVHKYLDKDSGKVMGEYISYVHSTWYQFDKAAGICPKYLKKNSLLWNVFSRERNEKHGVVK